MNNDNTNEWMNKDKEQQLTDNNIVHPLTHAGDDHLEDYNGAEKLNRMNQSW
jgi:hypothetical protein